MSSNEQNYKQSRRQIARRCARNVRELIKTTAGALAAATLLAACGGGANALTGGVSDRQSYSGTHTAVLQVRNNASVAIYTVHDDGTAQRTWQNAPNNSSGSATIAPAAAAKLFNDLQAAQPLNALPAVMTVDTVMTVSWNGEQSPNIWGTGANTIEQALVGDVNAVIQAFPS